MTGLILMGGLTVMSIVIAASVGDGMTFRQKFYHIGAGFITGTYLCTLALACR